MDDVHVSFEQAVQRLLRMYNTERSCLSSQITELQESLASYQDQLDQITREKNEQYVSLCSVECKLKRARAKIILQKEENEQLKNLLSQHGIVVPSKQSLLNTSMLQPSNGVTVSCTESSTAAVVSPHSSPSTPGRKSKSLQLRRQRRTPKGDTSGDSLQKSHETTMESILNKSDNSILTQDICFTGNNFIDKHPSSLTTEIDALYDQTSKSTEQQQVSNMQLIPTHPRTSDSMLDITDLQDDAWDGSDPSSPSLLSQQGPLLPTPPPSSTISTPASTAASQLTQEVVFISADKNSSLLHRKRKGLVADDLWLPVGRPSITSSTPAYDRAVSSANSLTIESPSHTKSMRHNHVIPPTPWHRPVRPSMLSNLLLSERREELKTPKDFEEQLSEEILPPVVAESLALDGDGDYEEERSEEEMEEDPEMTRPFVDTVHTTVEDADVTRSLIAPISTKPGSTANTSPKFAHTIPPVTTQTSTSTVASSKESGTGKAKTTLTEGQVLARNAGLPSYKCSVVVRRRQDRAKLDAQACPECEAWFRGDDGIHRDKRQHLKQICRHKHLYPPPESDPTFWDISFPDED